jgi:TRAP-type C4-dicarboxylate transport system permease small subunit
MRYPEVFAAVVGRLSKTMFWIASLALVSMMVLTGADVMLRAFRTPILGTYELVGLLGAVAVGFAIPQTTLQKGHVQMDFLTDRLTSRSKVWLNLVTRLAGVALFAVAGQNLWALGDDLRQSGEVSLTLQLPQYPVAYGVALCCLVECLVLLSSLWGQGRKQS